MLFSSFLSGLLGWMFALAIILPFTLRYSSGVSSPPQLLSDENGFQRKEWIDQRLKELNEIFAISVGGFSTMDNHLHLLLRMGAPLGARHLLCGEGRVGRIRF